MELNNREVALLLWLAVGTTFALTKPRVRRSTANLARSLIAVKIMSPLALFVVYVGGVLALADAAGLWRSGLMKDTVIWSLVAGLALLFNATSAGERGFFRRTALQTLSLSAVAGFYVDLFVLSLPAELVLQPVLFLLAGMIAVATFDARYRELKTPLEITLAIIALVLLGFVTVQLVERWYTLDTAELLREFLLPVWLTFAVLPFIHAFALVMAYEIAFMRLWFAAGRRAPPARAKVALMLGLHVHVDRIRRFAMPWTDRLAAAKTLREARGIVSEYARSTEHA